MIRVIRKLELYNQARKRRKLGKSYLELQRELGIPKSTLSSWFSKKKWSNKVRYTLVKVNKEKSKIHIRLLNKIRLQRKSVRDEEYRLNAKKMYEDNKNNPLFIAGVSIYWGEGEKVNKGRVSVINTDVSLLKLAINFYRIILKIPESKLRAAIFIYKDINPIKALNYWSKEIQLPKAQFIKTQILPSRSKLTKRKITNGICSIYFSSVESSIKIKEWIFLLGNDSRL